jgi:hypothetical protein
MKRFFFFALALFALSISSCTDDGNNTDLSTISFTIRASSWIESGEIFIDNHGFYVDLPMPELTDNVVNNGMVSLYRLRSSDGAWEPVPLVNYYSSYNGGYIYFFKKGILSIDYHDSDFQEVNPGEQTFKLVIIQPV